MADDITKNAPRAALITGAGRRIGAAIALALARAGYAVVLHANNSREDAERLAAAITGAGGRASVVLADLADHEAVRGLVPAAAAFGQLTLLVNNAGEFEPDDIETLSPARFQRAVAVNLAAPLFLSQAFAAQAPAGVDASIVNILDQRVLRPTPRFFSYTLSKSALLHRHQHAGAGIGAKASGQCGGARAQHCRARARPRCNSPHKQKTCRFNAGRGPDDIAAAVLYLAQAKSVTGVTIPVDGGQHLSWRTADTEVVE